MAKADKASDKKADTKGKSKAADKEEAAPEFKYGVADIAEALDIAPASVRVKLRNADIEKAGKSYGWNSKSELKEVIDELKGADAKAEKKAEKKDDKKSSDKKASGKKTDDKASGKKSGGKKKPADDDDDD